MDSFLTLRNLFATYKKVNKGIKNEVFLNKYMNNYIVFTPFDDCDRDSICNGISSEPYMYLINVLNTHKNLIVVWSQVEGTTSDYTIYHSAASIVKKSTYKGIMSVLESMNYKREIGWKYTFVKDNIEHPIKREEMIAQ